MASDKVLSSTAGDEILDFSQVVSPRPRPELRDDQREARDNPGNTLVNACAGAGKTEVLIQRHERALGAGKKCLNLTFTVAAANEIKRRIPTADAYTIHGFCCKSVGWNGNFVKLLRDYVGSKRPQEYDEVLVDEWQNITPLMLSAIKYIPKTSLFAVGDPYQACYIGEWARNAWDAPAMGLEAFDRVAGWCAYKEILGNRRANQHVVDVLETLVPRRQVALGPKTFGTSLVLARTHKELTEIGRKLSGANIPYMRYKRRDMQEESKYDTIGKSPRVDLMVYHQCVGTEYDRVFLFGWHGWTEEDDNLLYTGAARASQEVYTVGRDKGMTDRLPPAINISLPDMLDLLQKDH